MNSPSAVVSSWMLLGMVALALPVQGRAQELELERVMLSAGGVGYFEYEARVEGDAVLELSVRLSQVDDVMKSIVVYDDVGVAGTISLPGRDPLDQIFRDLPFEADALSSPVALLNALPGARIRASGPRAIEGRLVRVVPETTLLPGGQSSVTRHRVTVLSEEGMHSFLFEDADTVSFVDARLRAQIDGVLEAVSVHRTRDRRTLRVHSNGKGQRTVRVGYVVAAPLWKSSYRLSLAGEGAGTARLQGWAVLENMSAQDWKDVELTLVSGNPVTFRQALYLAYYADRPEVPVEVLGRVLPVPDSGAITLADTASSEREQELRRSPSMAKDEGLASPGAVPPGSPAGSMSSAMAASESVALAGPAPAPPPGQARILAAASSEAATSVSFRVPYPVSVSSGQSMLVPVIDRPVPAARVSLYQPVTHARHPLAAVRLENDGDTGLPPGVLTLYENVDGASSFLGDAQLSALPAGEQRLVSFALDQKTVVDREVESSQNIATGRIANGVLELTYAQRQRTLYRLQAPPREARDVLLEHPRLPGWRLDEPPGEQVELTEDAYRIPLRLEAGAREDLEVLVSRPLLQSIQLSSLDAEQFARYAATGELDERLRAAFSRMAQLRAVLDAHQHRVNQLEQDRSRIHQEQQRIRDNLSRIPRDSDLHQRYIQKLNEQEDVLESLHTRAQQARDAATAARDALTEYIQGLDL